MARKNLSLTEKLAGTLLRVKNPDGSWLIPEPLRSTGTAQEVYKAVQFDHAVLDCFEDDKVYSNRPQNIYPMLTKAHQEKSKVDNRNAKKVARMLKKEAERKKARDETAAALAAAILAPKESAVHGRIKRRWAPLGAKYDWGKGRYGRG